MSRVVVGGFEHVALRGETELQRRALVSAEEGAQLGVHDAEACRPAAHQPGEPAPRVAADRAASPLLPLLPLPLPGWQPLRLACSRLMRRRLCRGSASAVARAAAAAAAADGKAIIHFDRRLRSSENFDLIGFGG